MHDDSESQRLPRAGSHRSVSRAGIRAAARCMIVFLLLPSLILALSTEAAQADGYPLYGDAASTGDYVVNGVLGQFESTCNTVAYYAADSQYSVSVKYKSGCNYSWEFHNEGDAQWTYAFKGTTQTSSTQCSYNGSGSGKNPSGTTVPWVSTAGDGCAATQMCWALHVSDLGPDLDRSGCVPIALGAPPGAQTSTGGVCSDATVQKPVPYLAPGGWDGGNEGNTYVKGSTSHDVRRYAQWHVSVSNTGEASQEWAAYVIVDPTGGNGTSAQDPGTVHDGDDFNHSRQTVFWSGDYQNVDPGQSITLSAEAAISDHWDDYNYGYPPAQYAVVGVGIIRLNQIATVVSQEDYRGSSPYGTDAGQVGVTANCSNYWGAKIVTDAETGTPAGSIPPIDSTGDGSGGDSGGGTTGSPTEPTGNPTTPTGSGCNFSVTDPTSWAAGGMCAAVGLLGRIWQAIQDVVTAIATLADNIVNGLLGGLSGTLNALFVPSASSTQDDINSLNSAWSNTSIGKWKDAFTNQSFNLDASGCDGLPVNVDFGHGLAIDQHIGSSCSGPMAGVAPIVKIALSAGLVIFGAMGCLRALGSGFGWNPGGGGSV